MKAVSRDTLRGLFEGALGIRETEAGLQPIRLPVEDLEFHHESLRTAFRAEGAAGIRIRLKTGSRYVALQVRHDIPADFPAEPVYDLVDAAGAVTRKKAESADGAARVQFDMGDSRGQPVEIWLPPGMGVIVQALLVDDEAGVEACPDPSPRWVAYGSSITHCAWVPGPTETWPAIAARRLGWHLTCLGFNGGCHMDPLIARAMARLPADRFTLKLGINVHNLQTLRERTFSPLVHGFIQTLRDAQPTTPITVISPIISPDREDSGVSNIPLLRGGKYPFYGDISLNQMRDVLREAVDLYRRRGDANIAYLDGRELFGAADVAYLPDGLHPDPAGYALLGRRFADYFAAG